MKFELSYIFLKQYKRREKPDPLKIVSTYVFEKRWNMCLSYETRSWGAHVPTSWFLSLQNTQTIEPTIAWTAVYFPYANIRYSFFTFLVLQFSVVVCCSGCGHELEIEERSVMVRVTITDQWDCFQAFPEEGEWLLMTPSPTPLGITAPDYRVAVVGWTMLIHQHDTIRARTIPQDRNCIRSLFLQIPKKTWINENWVQIPNLAFKYFFTDSWILNRQGPENLAARRS